MKNRISGLLMETGVSYNKQRLHKVGYFTELMSGNEEIDCGLRLCALVKWESSNAVAQKKAA